MKKNIYIKIENIKNIFKDKADSESKYLAIIEMGKKLPPLNSEFKIPQNKISGCQSTTYLYSFFKNGLIHFQAESDALISSGLVALLIYVYNEQSPKEIINNPPEFINDLDINISLSPSRINGLSQIYVQMKNEAQKYL